MSLIFNDTAGKQGLIQDCETIIYGDNGYGQISGDANRLATFTRYINEGLKKTISIIQRNEKRWQWADNNDLNFPVGYQDLQDNVKDYPMDLNFLNILRVEVKDQYGNSVELAPFDQADISIGLPQFLNTNGTPRFYRKVANSLLLYPTPATNAVTLTKGLTVYFESPPSYFSVSDTNKSIGINQLYERLPALYASYEYAAFNTMTKAPAILERLQRIEGDITSAYVRRGKDEKTQLTSRTNKQISWR